MVAGHGRILVGGVQFSGVPGDKAANCDIAERLIREAAQEGAQIVLTPECVLTGFAGGCDERAMAEPIPGPCTARFARLARELGVAILLGLSELHGGQIYNATAVLWPDGHIRGVMRKVHISGPEIPAGWRNGSAFPVFDLRTPTGACRFGIMICYDRELPESARLLMLQGADIVFNPLACRCLTMEIHRCLLRTRAFENELYVVTANHAAPCPERPQPGHRLRGQHRGGNHGRGMRVCPGTRHRRAQRTSPAWAPWRASSPAGALRPAHRSGRPDASG